MGLLPFYEINLSLLFIIYEDFIFSLVFFIEDFYNICEFSTFWSDIGLFEAYFVPLLNGGRFFLFVYILEKLGITPLPFVAF